MMGTVVFLIFVILFILFLFGLFSVAEGRGGTAAIPRTRRRTAREHELSPTALLAMRHAGYQGGSDYVNVADVGLLAYRETDEPKLLRFGNVMLDTRYLRPFVELWLPHAARGPVRFELLDSRGRLRYVDESQYELARGQNTLVPGTWLPLQDRTIDTGNWNLRVTVGETLLAVHTFGWQTVGGGEIQRYAASDGELSPSLQRALHAHGQKPVSLDDLMAGQEE